MSVSRLLTCSFQLNWFRAPTHPPPFTLAPNMLHHNSPLQNYPGWQRVPIFGSIGGSELNGHEQMDWVLKVAVKKPPPISLWHPHSLQTGLTHAFLVAQTNCGLQVAVVLVVNGYLCGIRGPSSARDVKHLGSDS